MPARRSARATGPQTVYTEDPFQSAGISDGSDGEARTPKVKGRRARKDDSASDEEFVAVSNEEIDDAMEDDEQEGETAGNDDDASGDGDDMEIDEIGGNAKRAATSHPRFRKRHRDGTVAMAADQTHSRGIFDPKEHVSKSMHYTLAFGPDERDMIAAIYVRDRWTRGLDSTFPSRSSLEQAWEGPDYRYGPNFGVDPDDVQTERTRGWNWYYDRDLGERFRKRQRIETIKETEARRVYLPPKKENHTVLLGPVDNQQPFPLGHHESLDFGEAWGERKTRGPRDEETHKIREGWILNLGHRVLCKAWAPHQDGLTQYLAAVTPITDEQKKDYIPPEGESSSFQPSQPYPSALQLWEFKGKKSGTYTNTLDMNTNPKLRLVLCSDWGDIRRIAWCPVAREKRDEDEEEAAKTIGLLAGVWGDGKVRVLDIKVRRGSEETEFVKVHSPSFEAKPPSTVCTCIAWLSPSDIAVGCGNGFVAIWSIVPSSEPNPHPYFYYPVHESFVLNIASAYPAHPHLITTISIDGETRLWSIIDPRSDSVSTVRMRLASPHLSYSPMLQSFCANDENDFARVLPVRRFFTSNTIGKLPSSISTLAPCSFWHPFIMYGGTGGEVMATNPLRRLLYPKEQLCQQMWFTHDWSQGPVGSSGVSRFHEGYQAEKQSLARNLVGEHRPVSVTITTIYDEGTHVTALAWNPNRPCAAWASAALGCGLVRVEDLAM